MTIEEIYSKLEIPPNLQDHMLQVASVTDFICNHWVGESLKKEEIIVAALLHDLGNIVKFDLEKHPEFLGDEVKNIDYWKKVQTDVIAKYGTDDHKATEIILSELGITQNIVDIIQSKSFGSSVETAKSNNWELKILFYSDLRVMPNGLCSLEERLGNIISRLEKYRNRPDINDLMNACREIEKQIQQNLNVSVLQINGTVTKEQRDHFLAFEFK